MAERQASGLTALDDLDGFEFVFDQGCFARIQREVERILVEMEVDPNPVQMRRSK